MSFGLRVTCFEDKSPSVWTRSLKNNKTLFPDGDHLEGFDHLTLPEAGQQWRGS